MVARFLRGRRKLTGTASTTMAEMLKRENDILTLKVELSPPDRVRFTLQFHDGGPLISQPMWHGALAELGLLPDDERARGRMKGWLKSASFRLPGELLDRTKQGLEMWRSIGPWREPALWVHLVKPYGVLRYLPWERLLGDAFNVPVLMLPDFIFPPPRESASDLDVAICASAPLNCEEHHIHTALHETIGAVLHGCDRQVRIHVFADAAMHAQLRDNAPHTDAVILYDPVQAAPYVESDPTSRLVDKAGTLRSPWLLWMREALKNVSTDVVHFVCHGHLSGNFGAMLFAQSPLTRTDNYLAGPVGCTELSGFLTQVGAWATVFSAPWDNHNPPGLRALADEIAQTLPGPLMLFDRGQGGPEELEAGYRFVHAPRPQSPPRARGLYLYCQPYLLSNVDRGVAAHDIFEHIGQRAETYARNMEQTATVANVLRGESESSAPSKSISAVTAATERVAEQVQLQYQQVFRDEVIPDEIAHRDMNLAMATIDRLRQAVGQIEKRRLIGEIDSELEGMDREYVEDAERFQALAKEKPIEVPSIETAHAAEEKLRLRAEQRQNRIVAAIHAIEQLPDAEDAKREIQERLIKADEVIHEREQRLLRDGGGVTEP